MSNFTFALGEQCHITVSGEAGIVMGRAEYLSSPNHYWLFYKDADGCARECWWREDQLASDGIGTQSVP